jgi:multimeric flavodoxin WrbA
VSANIVVIYSGALRDVAEMFGEAAEHLSACVRGLRAPGDERSEGGGAHPDARFGDLEWADGIAFGTPVGDGHPAAALMGSIEATEPLWSSGCLHDKVVTVFTDEPDHFAPDSVLHPIYDALYHWGAVIVGPRAFELASDAQRRHGVSEGGGSVCVKVEECAVSRPPPGQDRGSVGRRARAARAVTV